MAIRFAYMQINQWFKIVLAYYFQGKHDKINFGYL